MVQHGTIALSGGHKGQFTRYIDISCAISFPDDVGICNRIIKCGYNYTPQQYFDKQKDNYVKYEPIKKLSIPPAKPFDFIDMEVVKKSMNYYDENNFVLGLKNLFGMDVAMQAVEKYSIGTSKHFLNATAFFQIDIDGRIRQAKVIPYNSKTLGRDKDLGVWFGGKTILKSVEANLLQCFFGECLLRDTPNSTPVAIVESEKTAVVCSIVMPDFVWLATGGRNGCKWLDQDVNRPLKDRTVTLFPDNDAFDDWTKKAKTLEINAGCKVRVSGLIKNKFADRPKADLADVILENVDADFGWVLTEVAGYPKFWDLK